MTDRVVLAMKWGTLYGAEYVNVLYNAVRDHMTGPFRFTEAMVRWDRGLRGSSVGSPCDHKS